MNINRFIVFASVARTGNLSQTAEELYMTQPAVSQSIHAFEKELGLTLIQRRFGGIELTEAGQKLAADAAAVVQQTDHFFREAARLRKQPDRLRVFYTGRLERELIAGAISLDENNQLNLSLSYGAFAEAESRLENGEADVVFSMPTAFTKKWNTVTLLTSPMKVVSARGTFKQRKVSMEELRHYKIAILDRQAAGVAGIRFIKQMTDLGFEEENLIRTDSIESQMLLVESGKAVSLMPSVGKEQGDVELVELDGKFAKLETICAFRQETPRVRLLIELCFQAARQMD